MKIIRSRSSTRTGHEIILIACLELAIILFIDQDLDTFAPAVGYQCCQSSQIMSSPRFALVARRFDIIGKS